MTTAAFPFCCGISIIADFGNTNHALNSKKYTKEEVENFLESRAEFGSYGGGAFKMIVLNDDQNKLFKGLMKKYGFRCIAKNYHSSHDSEIFIYIKKNPKKKSK